MQESKIGNRELTTPYSLLKAPALIKGLVKPSYKACPELVEWDGVSTHFSNDFLMGLKHYHSE
jgi:hypothetical protein